MKPTCSVYSGDDTLADDQPHNRLLIIGNGGSGKTWLAQKLGVLLGNQVIHLDDLHWEPERYGVAREKAVRDELAAEASSGERWIMEGVYGELARMVLGRVTMLVWLDLPEDECVANAVERGIQGGGSQTKFQGLLKWIAEYRTRKNNLNSFDYHQQLFNQFRGARVCLNNREQIAKYVADFESE